MLSRKLFSCTLLYAGLALGGPSPATQPAQIAVDPPREWTIEPAWMQSAPPQVQPATPPPARPEPIPLPAATIVGPVVLTAILATAAIKKNRRPRVRVIR